MANRFEIRICQPLKDGELFAFYERNNICEAEYGQDVCERVLQHPGVWVAAYDDARLIGFARALHDGLYGVIAEFCLDLEYQEPNDFDNGCFVQSDPHGVGRQMGLALMKELRRRGCYFFSKIIYGNDREEAFYSSLGFYENGDHKELIIDARPYVPEGDARGKRIDDAES